MAEPTPPPASPRTLPAAAAPAGPRAWFAWRDALRWFGAEFLVVVTGVLVALALQAWYEGRRDAARERGYLRQLAADLRESERRFAAAEAENAPSEVAAAKLTRAFYLVAPPPRDSLLRWFLQADSYELAVPITATAEALVATGELTLIRSDSVRAAVTAYLETTRRRAATQATFEREFLAASDALERLVDPAEVVLARRPAALIDSVARANPTYPLPPGARRIPFPFDAPAFLRDREAHFQAGQLLSAKRNMAGSRAEMRAAARALQALVDGALRR